MRTVVYILAVAAAIVGIGSFFKISDIQVTGNVIYSSKEILDVAPIESGDNLFLINKRSIEESILENRNFVDTVTVSRKLPDTVEINILESQLLASVEVNGAYFVLNRKCQILSKTDAEDASRHIRITGIEPLSPRVGEQLKLGVAEAAKEDYLADVMEMMLVKEMYSYVSYIDISNISSLKFDYRDNLVIDLGKHEELERKFDMLERILADLAENDRGTISLAKVGEGHFIPEQ